MEEVGRTWESAIYGHFFKSPSPAFTIEDESGHDECDEEQRHEQVRP